MLPDVSIKIHWNKNKELELLKLVNMNNGIRKGFLHQWEASILTRKSNMSDIEYKWQLNGTNAVVNSNVLRTLPLNQNNVI